MPKDGVSFHSFPKDDDLRRVWVKAVESTRKFKKEYQTPGKSNRKALEIKRGEQKVSLTAYFILSFLSCMYMFLDDLLFTVYTTVIIFINQNSLLVAHQGHFTVIICCGRDRRGHLN